MQEYQYLELLKTVMENGVDTDDRTGIGTRSLFGYQMRFDLSKSFPAITTKKLAWKPLIAELLWFIEGSTDERRLAEIQYGKPREELIGKKTIWTANADFQGKNLGYENTDLVKELGPIYGFNWRNFDYYKGSVSGVDQISDVIEQIKTNPSSRRLIVSSWNPMLLDDAALPSCHTLFQFKVIKNKLSCQLYQRSGDCFLGIPFNIASYSLLTHMIAQVCDLEVGDFVHTIGDAHIYKNHFDAVDEQLERSPMDPPSLWLNPEIKNIDDFTMDDIKIINYKSHPTIKAPMAV